VWASSVSVAVVLSAPVIASSAICCTLLSFFGCFYGTFVDVVVVC
jgi:hypothetical protein